MGGGGRRERCGGCRLATHWLREVVCRPARGGGGVVGRSRVEGRCRPRRLPHARAGPRRHAHGPPRHPGVPPLLAHPTQSWRGRPLRPPPSACHPPPRVPATVCPPPIPPSPPEPSDSRTPRHKYIHHPLAILLLPPPPPPASPLSSPLPRRRPRLEDHSPNVRHARPRQRRPRPPYPLIDRRRRRAPSSRPPRR